MTATSAEAVSDFKTDIEAYQQSSVDGTKGFLDIITERFLPSGIYFQLDGKDFFFGEYSDRNGLDHVKYKGSLWEVRINGKVSAHGYGETPGWVVDMAEKHFGW